LFKQNTGRKNSKEFERVIFEMFYQRIYNTAYFIIQDQFIAQDVAQETFLKAFQHIHKVENGEKMGAWLGTIATRTALDFLRKIKRRNDIPTEDVYMDEEVSKGQMVSSSVEKIVEDKFLKHLIKQNIEGLKIEYRNVLVLKYEYDLKDEEIAEALDVSISAVKSRLHRARLKLKTMLRNQPGIRNGDIS
jgi:RNA polymerase sigma factor (sigma-70 family)